MIREPVTRPAVTLGQVPGDLPTTNMPKVDDVCACGAPSAPTLKTCSEHEDEALNIGFRLVAD